MRGIWHAEAKRLRDDEHWTYQRIATHFSVSPAAVYFVLNPDRRAWRAGVRKPAPDSGPGRRTDRNDGDEGKGTTSWPVTASPFAGSAGVKR